MAHHNFLPAVKNYTLIEHTADIGIHVTGKTIKDLYKTAALAMFDIIAEKVPGKTRRLTGIIVKQEADNPEELLVNWLNELLSLSAVKELIFERFSIRKLTPTSMQAHVSGSSANGFRMNAEIKAATRHGLEVYKRGPLWHAKVIFDV